MAKTTKTGKPAKTKLSSFRIQEELIEKIRGLSYWQRETITNLVNTALEEFIARHEKKSGPIQPAPEEHLQRLQARAGGPRKDKPKTL